MPIDAVRRFEVGGQVCTVATAVLQLDPGANQVAVAAVSGKRVRIMGLVGQSNTTTLSQCGFHDGSGGSYLLPDFYYPINTADIFVLPFIDSGYCETSTGTGLYITVQTAAIKMALQYILWTPS